MSAREIECRRRRRERRAALAAAEIEFANGGPLVDAFAPIMQPLGVSSLEYASYLEAEALRRAHDVDAEARRLAAYFTRQCWVVIEEQARMLLNLSRLLTAAGPPRIEATHSTDLAARTSGTTIPAL